METTCTICGNKESNTLYEVKERMLGTGDTFVYFQCGACECLQIADSPADIAKYYPADYYSFTVSPEENFKGKLSSYLKQLRHTYLLTGKNLAGKFLTWLIPNRYPELENFRYADLKKSDKILDVGSGNGLIPYLLMNAGFRHTKGIDPYLAKDIQYKNGLQVLKTGLFAFEEYGWDKVMFNHSFEHLADPFGFLQRVHQLLKPGGQCILRIPTVSSEAWEIYKEYWVQLDAPRHYFLYSVKSISLLALATGFTVKNICYESGAFQFIGSEQYRKDISLYGSPLSYYKGNDIFFTAEEIRAFQIRADQLNKEGRGDTIAVILQKK
jgi:SAM-dependent methyltransferase